MKAWGWMGETRVPVTHYAAGIYLLKVNYGNTITMCETYSERRRYGVFIINF